jgi:hypothetical protein
VKDENEPTLPAPVEGDLDAFVDAFADWIADLLDEGKLEWLLDRIEQEEKGAE